MNVKSTPLLLITANVGSIFEDPSVMLKIWTEEFLSTVTRLDPKFVALHCQEVGGKNYEESMKHVEYFVRLLMSSDELRLFDKVRIYLDEDFSSAENFTALGNFYFIHESITEVLMWNFKELCFVAVEGKEVHSDKIEDVMTKEKSKFPQDFFPECKWSRKGFLRTRWNLNGTVFDLINIHLFHDASNFIAMETYPSVYSLTRQRALEYTLERFHHDVHGTAPFFLFGDFNFRTDTQGVIKKLADGLNAVRVESPKNSDHTMLQYKDNSSQVILTLGKKEFNHQNHQNVFIENTGEWLKEYDRELEAFSGQLFEFPITFQPSYPFEEDSRRGNCYMRTRCPSWCDRVVLSETARPLVMEESGIIEYGLIGEATCMGDHKPVYLRAKIARGAGRLSCCSAHPLPPAPPDPSLWAQPVAASIHSILSPKPSSLSETKRHELVQIDEAHVIFDLQSLSDSDLNVAEFDEKELRLPRYNRLNSDSSIGSYLGSKKQLGMGKDIKMYENQRLGYERYIVKRVQSASFVEVKVGAVKQGPCKWGSEWRARSVSISGKPTPVWRTNSKMRLISNPNLRSSRVRMESHHSSSDEDWFEEVSNEGKESELTIVKEPENITSAKEAPEELNPSALDIDVPEPDNLDELKKVANHSKRKNKLCCLNWQRCRRRQHSAKPNSGNKESLAKSRQESQDCCQLS